MELNIVSHCVGQQVTRISFFGTASADIGCGNFQRGHVNHQNCSRRRLTQGEWRRSKARMILVAQGIVSPIYGIAQRMVSCTLNHYDVSQFK